MAENIHISEVQNSDQKSFYTKEILETLPGWFGNKQALEEYAEQVKGFPYMAHSIMRINVLAFFL